MKKVAIVNQRYGHEVNGGSEDYTRKLALRLQPHYDVEVLTTCARDYDTWENFYKEGLEQVDGISVRRFKVDKTRQGAHFVWWDRARRYVPFAASLIEQKWIEAQGPCSYDFIKYIEEHSGEYDCFIFVTYLYYLTAMGLPKVADKAILVPTAHDEPYIFMKAYREIFTRPKGIIYLTEEEKTFVNQLFHNQDIPSTVAAIGIDIDKDQYSGSAFREKYDIQEDYVIYVGRIDTGKGCGQLFEYFKAYKAKYKDSKLKLVLLGKKMMDIPSRDDIVSLGFVSEEDKYNAISGAKALALPSEYESLSISVLEAMALETPVLVNGNCAVLKGHCERSGGGRWYDSQAEFEEGLLRLTTDEDFNKYAGTNGRKYVENNYDWGTVIDKVKALLEE